MHARAHTRRVPDWLGLGACNARWDGMGWGAVPAGPAAGVWGDGAALPCSCTSMEDTPQRLAMGMRPGAVRWQRPDTCGVPSVASGLVIRQAGFAAERERERERALPQRR